MLIVISGPSGSGKGTVIKKLCEDANYELSVSMTTRLPRLNETEGREYFFRTEAEFFEIRDNGALLEYARYNGNYYGTPREYVEKQMALGVTVILEIEVDGALQVMEKFAGCVTIFIAPPDKHELEQRLRLRKTQTDASIIERLEIADREISFADRYGYIVVNDIVEKAAASIKSIVAAERLRTFRNLDILSNLKSGGK